MDRTIEWLLEGDVSIQYLTHLLLLESSTKVLQSLQNRIPEEGYGLKFLKARNENGHWGHWFYQPKWTCTHYTLADLKELGMPPSTKECREMVVRAFDECMQESGGINFAKTIVHCDIAVNGMVLNYASYFCPDERRIEKLAEYIVSNGKPDGGYSWDESAKTSDAHTTICVLEGFSQYQKSGFKRCLDKIRQSEKDALEWLLSNGLFEFDDKRYRKLSHPYRYRYDLLRVLEYFVSGKVPYDARMEPAMEWLMGKRSKTGQWPLENVHKGNMHFELECRGDASRFITLKALYVLKSYGNHFNQQV